MIKKIIVLTLVVNLFSCKKEEPNPPGTTPVNPPSTPAAPTVTGTVVDSTSFINFRVGTGPYFTSYQSVTYDKNGKFESVGGVKVQFTENMDITTGKITSTRMSITSGGGFKSGQTSLQVSGEKLGATSAGTYTRGVNFDIWTYWAPNGNSINVYTTRTMTTALTTLSAERCIGSYTTYTEMDSIYPVTGFFNFRR